MYSNGTYHPSPSTSQCWNKTVCVHTRVRTAHLSGPRGYGAPRSGPSLSRHLNLESVSRLEMSVGRSPVCAQCPDSDPDPASSTATGTPQDPAGACVRVPISSRALAGAAGRARRCRRKSRLGGAVPCVQLLSP